MIIDNLSATANSLSQRVINLRNGDYTYNNGSYLINVPIPIIANKSYTIKAKIFYSDATNTPYSALKAFTSGPTTPVIVSAFGDAMTSIFLSIQPQSEVLNYSAFFGVLFRARSFLSRNSCPSFLLSAFVIFCVKYSFLETCI